MALATYSDLKTAVADWLHRSDLTTKIVDFIALCEANIRRDVRCRAMEASATGSLAAVTLAFPTRMAEVRRVMLDGYQLEYVHPESFHAVADTDTRQYTTEGETFVFQKATGNYEIEYWQWFAPFSGNSDTNWLLTNYPAIYLYGTLAEAASFLRDDPSVWISRYVAEVNRIRATERLVNGPLVVRTAGVV